MLRTFQCCVTLPRRGECQMVALHIDLSGQFKSRHLVFEPAICVGILLTNIYPISRSDVSIGWGKKREAPNRASQWCQGPGTIR